MAPIKGREPECGPFGKAWIQDIPIGDRNLVKMLSPVAISKMTNDDAYDLARMFALWSAVDIENILKALVVALKFVTDESYWGEFFYGLAGTQYHKGELESLVTTFENAIICNTTDEIYLQYDKARVLKELGGRRAEIEVCCDRILELGLGDPIHDDEVHSMIYDVLPVNPKYISRYSFTDADASGNNDCQNLQQNQLKESFNMDDDKKTTDGHDHLTKNPIIVTEQDLMEEIFVNSKNFKVHKYYKKEMRLEKLKRSNNQTEKEFKKYLHDMNDLFNCYKEAINYVTVCSSCEFYEFHDFRANMHERNGEYYKAISDYNYAIKDLYHIPDGYISKGRMLLYCGRTVRALKNFDMALRVASAEDFLILSGEDLIVEDIKDCYSDIKGQIKKYLKLNPEAESKRELKRWLALTRVRLGKKIDSLLLKQRNRRNLENPMS